MSPNCVPYPRRSSVLLLVPITIPSGHERSYSMLLRSRAILFPTRILPATSLQRKAEASGQTAKHKVVALVAQQRIARALARDEVGIDLADEEVLVELGGARNDGPVGCDHLGSSPERNAVLVADAIDIDEVHGQVLRVEAVHEPTRLGGAEVAALGDAATRARRRTKDDRRAGRGVEVWHRDVPEVFANGDPGAPAGGRERLEAIAGAEVAPVIEDPVRRQIHLAMDVNELAFRPVALGDVQLRVARALHEPGRYVEIARRLCQRREERSVDGAGDVGSEGLQVVARERKLREHDQPRARIAGPRDPLAMHLEIALHGAARRRALRDRDADRAQEARSRSRRSAYSCTSVQARSSSGPSA